MTARALATLALLVLVVAPVRLSVAAERTFTFDVVALIDDGRQVEGSADFAMEWGLYTYRFSVPEHQAKFLNDPERYAVQMGGACGRMGPLSGEGDPSIFGLHAGKLYIFASEQCRTTFLAAPEKLVEPVDAAPDATVESAQRGCELVDLIINTIGIKGVDMLGSYAETNAYKSTYGEKVYSITKTASWDFFRGVTVRTEAWNDESWGVAVQGDQAFMYSGDDRRPLDGSQRAVFEKETGRNLLMLLRSRKDPAVIITHTGTDQVYGGDADLVTFYKDGAATTIAVDARGRVLAIRYRGRGPEAEVGDVEIRLANFRRFERVQMPTKRTFYFNGKEVPELSVGDLTIIVDQPVDRSMFFPKDTS